MTETGILGWDLGGAHLKVVALQFDGRVTQSIQLPCPLWQGTKHLEYALDQVATLTDFRAFRHAITMSGEMADVFPDRKDGVAALVCVMGKRFSERRMGVYAGRLGFIPMHDAASHWSHVASANWHASAAFLAHEAGEALLVDLGSTTCDLSLLAGDKVHVRGFSDKERLRFEELVYTGVVRTPVMAVTRTVPFAGEWQGVAAEHFATMADVYRLTGELPEAYDQTESADGAPKTPEDSARRLARMVGCDAGDSPDSWVPLARVIRECQLHNIQCAAERALSRGMLSPNAPLVGAGVGRFLLRSLADRLGREYIDISAWVHGAAEHVDCASICLPAYAVGRLMLDADIP